MATKAKPQSGIHISTFWTTFIVQAVVLVFLAGQGWWRLSQVEDVSQKLGNKYEQLNEKLTVDRSQLSDRLLKVELRSENIDKNVERLLGQIEGIVSRTNSIPSLNTRK